MIYTDREKLTCYIMPDESDEVRFGELRSLLMERPSNVIYCEKDGRLYGIISMGDVERAYKAGKDSVAVNKRFTRVGPNEYMRVKQAFRDNDMINALPVVSDSNELIGDYSRWDDLIAVNDFAQLKFNKHIKNFWGVKRFALVRPCNVFVKKQEIVQAWKENFLKAGVQVSVINREDVMDTFGLVDYILFTDEDELRGTGSLYTYILDKEFDWGKSKTYDMVNDTIMKSILPDAIMNAILSKGIHVFTLNCEENKSDYWKILQKDISGKFSKIGKRKQAVVYEEFRKDFFAELYSEEYAEKVLSHNYAITHANGINKLKDVDTETYKVADGERRTQEQPSDYQRCIYFYGPCMVIGVFVDDEHTIESFLQTRLNAKGYKVKCVNYGAFGDQMTQLNRVASTRLNKGDIVILHSENRKYEGVPNINLADICEKYNVPAEWMVESPLHCNHKLNSIYADEIFERIELIVQEDIAEKKMIDVKNDFITLAYLERYFYGFAERHKGVNGSIVMNCNPFTLGHRYLIEQALKQVDYLIIFVVEEDKSVFTFKERFAMVVEGTKDLENVMVVPSGKLILSQTTFPEYFLKIEDEDIVHNVEFDITLFAEQIAPKLNITYRFVGEEPEDKVTDEYNEAMKRILPKYGINIIEIPRAKVEGKMISASSVREKLLKGKSTDIERLVPLTTKRILDICWE